MLQAKVTIRVGIIPNYDQNDATFLDLFISTDALHVSGGFSAHHQEHIIVNTASVIVNQYCCLLLSWMRWNAFPSHPRQQPAIPVSEQAQMHALDRATAGMDIQQEFILIKYLKFFLFQNYFGI